MEIPKKNWIIIRKNFKKIVNEFIGNFMKL